MLNVNHKLLYNNNIDNFIRIKLSQFDFEHIKKVIDLSTLIYLEKIDFSKYYTSSKKQTSLQLMNTFFLKEALSQNIFNIPRLYKFNKQPKAEKMLDIYYRITNHNFTILYTVIINFEKIYLSVNKYFNSINAKIDINLQLNKLHKNNKENSIKVENNNQDSIPENKSYIDIIDNKIISKPINKINHEFNQGSSSDISLYNISKLDNENVLKLLNINLGGKIIKKTYLKLDYTENNTETKIIKSLSNKYYGKELEYYFFHREIHFLKKLYKQPHFPSIMSIDYVSYSVYMNYCGESVTNNNIPNNWKQQILKIIDTLKKCLIYNNDMWIYNFLIKDQIIYLIDFGWGDVELNYPFVHPNDNHFEKHNTFIDFLDRVFIDSIYFRFNYHRKFITS